MRSLLFVPADSERKLARAPHSGADALILDLEDSVVPANRTLARRQARDFLVSTTAGGLRRYIRINPLSSGAALDDLAAVVPGKPDGILLPKCLPEDLRGSIITSRRWRWRRRCRAERFASSQSRPNRRRQCLRSADMPESPPVSKPSPGVRRIWRLLSAAAIDGRTEPMTT